MCPQAQIATSATPAAHAAPANHKRRHGAQPPAHRKKLKAAEPVNGLHSRHRAGSSACENAPSAIYAPLRHSRREETPHE